MSARTLGERFPRFVVVGGLCAVLTNVAVIGLVRYGFGSVTASVIAFGPILLLGYGLHSLFTFSTRPTRLAFGRYTLAMLSNFPLWALLLYLSCDVLKIPVAVAAPAATVLICVWNYLWSRWAFLPGAAPKAARTSPERQT
jgi:putative flippase GtrA